MDINTLNVGLPLLADCFVFVLLLIAINSRRSNTRREWLLGLTLTAFFLLIVTSLKQAMYAGYIDATLLPLVGFLDYALSIGSYVFFYLYTLAFISHRCEVRPMLWRVAPIWGGVMIVLFASSYLTGMFFTFDAMGRPRVTSIYWILMVGIYVTGLMTLVVAYVYRDVLQNEVLIVIFLYALIPLFLSVVVDNATGLNTVYLAVAFMLMVLYGFVDHEQHLRDLQTQVRLAEQQNEVAEARVRSAVSQIQPHFLSNAISSIMVLCQHDPDEAVEALSDFSDYLRGNLNAVSAKGPIPFENELSHVEAYMALEKRRFGEKLQVQYDIQARDFVVPVLAVQVLMENAVKHGVGQKREGGTVRLSTRETNSTFVVTVEDDGVGFDVAAFESKRTEEPDPAKPGSHVGIRNAKRRLEMTCGGSLDIESTPGEGTVATIELPKEAIS